MSLHRCHELFDIKTDNFGNPLKHKCRLVLQGNTQKYGESYFEVYAPVTTPEAIRILFSVANQCDWGLRQFDFSTAYLNAPLEEEIDAYPPIGVEDPDGLGRIWRLIKSLYGAKQSARNWNSLLATLFREFGLRLISEAHYVWANDDFILATHVDDLALAYRNEFSLEKFKQFFAERNCIMNDLGEISQFWALKYTEIALVGYFKLLRPDLSNNRLNVILCLMPNHVLFLWTLVLNSLAKMNQNAMNKKRNNITKFWAL